MPVAAFYKKNLRCQTTNGVEPLTKNLAVSQLGPLATVICICHNHEGYVVEALQSVIEQCYTNIELIVIDNGSTDLSVERIHEFVEKHPTVRFIRNLTNQGLNRAFNQGLALARGQYIIDLSADDVLLPYRVARQVSALEQLPNSYGVVFSNAAYVDANGRETGYHYPIDLNGRAWSVVPVGDVFIPVLASYFICTPTMLIRREVLTELGGYDETLAYEDFDFWVRSARRYQYAYVDEVLTHKRQLAGSLSTQVTLSNNPLLATTLAVCRKAFALCHNDDERAALAIRLRACIRKAFYAEQFDLAMQFGTLHHQIAKPNALTRLVLRLSRLRIRVNTIYRWYVRCRTKQV